MLYLRYATGFLRDVVWPVVIVLSLFTILASVSNANVTSPTATPNSVTLTWTAPGDDGDVGTATVYDVRYSTSLITEANWNSAIVASGAPAPQPAGSSESFTITGLDPSTTYYFAIKTADEASNWSDLSNVATISTLAETDAPANVADLNIIERFETSIHLGWTAPGDDGNSGTASVYDLRFSTSTITEQNWDAATQVANEPTPSIAGTAETLTVTGLLENTTYFFALKTADEVPNWSGLSNIATMATGDDIPPANIDDLQASSGDHIGDIDLSWTAPGDDGLFGDAASYEIRYSLEMITPVNFSSATLCDSAPAPITCGDTQSHTLCDLNPGEMYYVCMITYDDAGNPSALSNVDSAVAYWSIISDVDDEQDGLPDHFELLQNYPNPFNPSTEIRFNLPTGSHVDLSIYNSVGRKVTTLVDRYLTAGEHRVTWNGTGSSGQNVATGVYFYRLLAEDFSDSKKMVLLK